MKILKFVMYLFYRYYSTGGTKSIPYFSALCAVVFLIYIHIFQLFIIINKVEVFGMGEDNSRIENYGRLVLFLLPIFLIIGYLIKPNDLKSLKYKEDKIKKGNIYLIAYCALNCVVLFLLILFIPKK